MFHSELRNATGRLPVEVEEGLWDLVARGIVTADGFQAVRSLLSARQAWKRRQRHEQRLRPGARRSPPGARAARAAGPCCPRAGPDDETDRETLAEQVAGQLLARWGVVFWDLMARENLALPVARGGVGTPEARGTRHRARWPFRHRSRRRAVRAPRSRRGASPGATHPSQWADGAAERGRPAQPGGDHPPRGSRHGRAHELDHLPRRRPRSRRGRQGAGPRGRPPGRPRHRLEHQRARRRGALPGRRHLRGGHAPRGPRHRREGRQNRHGPRARPRRGSATWRAASHPVPLSSWPGSRGARSGVAARRDRGGDVGARARR